MNRTQLINFILNYSFQPDFLTHKHKEDILKIIVDNNETHSILVSMNKKNTDIDLEQLTDNSINQICDIILLLILLICLFLQLALFILSWWSINVCPCFNPK